ncbi:hypothetical protein DOK67_0001598 [Enterococcus sp. DIV0212c]|uniref:SpaA isopeptide-forming pilin-related protein n=1 Tax=Enterococcus sp. DIV0212c TaxID=2230867 RepID=UPI001A9AF148|nr:SpaA isopeptide-forming pilin-related protein [Enterococcus sp. DIV0212c]MBO1354196.1 hypothetical protein [Enterococcus sp. DIV0212c]
MKQRKKYLLFPILLFLLMISTFGWKTAEATGNNSWSVLSESEARAQNLGNQPLLETERTVLEKPTPRTFCFVKRGAVQVVKYDKNTNARLAGAQFTIYDRWGCIVQVIESNYNGVAYTNTLPLGYYSIKETKAPAGYKLESSVRTFNLLKNGQLVCFTKCNEPLPIQKGSLKIVKTGEDNQVLAGASFDVFNANNQFVGRIATNVNGVAYLGNLPYGTYKLIEIKAPADYQLDSTPKYVTVSSSSPEGTATIYITNKKAVGSLQIIKKDEQGKLLAGANFNVYNSKNQVVGTIVTNTNGVATLNNLPYGEYTVLETIAPEGYEKDPTLHDVTISKDNANGVAKITVVNKKKVTTGTLQIIKIDEQGRLLSGAEFQIFNSKNVLIKTVVTGSNGVAALDNLPFDTYTVSESKAPEGYEPDGTLRSVTVSKDDPEGVVSIIVVNKKAKTTGNLEVIKKDEAGVLLAGAEFDVKDAKDKLVGKITTDANGVGKLKDLPFGTYKVIETKAPAGYELNVTPKEVTVSKGDPNGVVSITITNKKEITTGNLEVIKKDEAGALLAGAEFDVKDAKDKLVGKITTDANGVGKLKDLPFGTYKVIETKAPAGYELDVTPKEVTVSKGDPNGVVSITITNKKEITTGNLEVIKKDEAGVLLADAEFEVYDASDKLVDKITTDANGVAGLKDLPFGTYKLIETKAPTGYELDATPKFIKISKDDPNGTSSIDVINKKEVLPTTGTLKIIKYVKDSNPIVYLPGAVFGVYDSETELMGSYTTDQNGEIILNDLAEGKYYVVEIEAPPGYEEDTTFYEIDVEAGKVAEIRHANVKKDNLGGLKIVKYAKTKEGFETDTVLPNTEFEVTDSTGKVHKGVTDVNGELFFPNLPSGKSTIKETKAPDGYELDSTEQTAEITVGEIVDKKFYNTAKQEQGRMLVYVSSNNTKQDLKGLEYIITSANGVRFDTIAVTNAFGQISLNLPPGEYEIAPFVQGYSASEPTKFKIQAKKFTIVKLTV